MSRLNIDAMAASQDIPHTGQVVLMTMAIRSKIEREAHWRQNFRFCTWDTYTNAAYVEALAKIVKEQTPTSKWHMTIWLERHSPYGPEIQFDYLGENGDSVGKVTFTIAYSHRLSDDEARQEAARFVEAQAPSKWRFSGLAPHGEMQARKITFEYLGNLN